MTRRLTAIAMAAALSVGVAVGAEVFSVNTVGAMKVPLVGNGTFNLVSVPMHKLPVNFGTVTGNDTNANTITDSGATWAGGQYNDGVTGQEATGASTFYVEITSGVFEGRHFYIVSNTGTELTLAADSQSGIPDNGLVGETYKIVPANRIRDIFGEPGDSVMAGGTDPVNADYIIPWEYPGYGQQIYYNSIGSTYVQLGAGLAADYVIDRDAGVFYFRRAATDTNVCVTGEVSGNKQAVVLLPGFNLVGGQNVVDPQLDDANLLTGVSGGANDTDADSLIAWSSSGGFEQVIYYNTIGSAWVQLGSGLVGTRDDVVAGGSGIFVNKKNGSGVWERPTPLD